MVRGMLPAHWLMINFSLVICVRLNLDRSWDLIKNAYKQPLGMFLEQSYSFVEGLMHSKKFTEKCLVSTPRMTNEYKGLIPHQCVSHGHAELVDVFCSNVFYAGEGKKQQQKACLGFQLPVVFFL